MSYNQQQPSQQKNQPEVRAQQGAKSGQCSSTDAQNMKNNQDQASSGSEKETSANPYGKTGTQN